MSIFCRSCNREIHPDKEDNTHYIEWREGTRHIHAKVDCDEVKDE